MEIGNDTGGRREDAVEDCHVVGCMSVETVRWNKAKDWVGFLLVVVVREKRII